jgi:hypothetical protein
LILLVALAVLGGCTSEAQIAGTPDPVLSAEVQPQLAECLGLPEDSVVLQLDDQRQVLHMRWEGPDGFKPKSTNSECYDELDLTGERP